MPKSRKGGSGSGWGSCDTSSEECARRIVHEGRAIEALAMTNPSIPVAVRPANQTPHILDAASIQVRKRPACDRQPPGRDPDSTSKRHCPTNAFLIFSTAPLSGSQPQASNTAENIPSEADWRVQHYLHDTNIYNPQFASRSGGFVIQRRHTWPTDIPAGYRCPALIEELSPVLIEELSPAGFNGSGSYLDGDTYSECGPNLDLAYIGAWATRKNPNQGV